ncbi:hypothetical protein D3869_32000 (plasmid) [Azospirillum brasilense]|uniref:Transposase n=2 Tax=Azospirillum brasilense TaxID=192 RepID=A0A4D8RSX7_AZOBR|nr:hypothetical protein D3869_29060 [Azospirillum brasilense]QCO19832.1 hypothetical protein D3869_32000 [Azospirillum brasilense]
MGADMRAQAVERVGGIIDRIENRHPGPGGPPVPTAEVIRTLGFFVREGVQWPKLKAADGRVSGSTRRHRMGRRGGQLLGAG